jgi:hypothetical protein
MRITTATNIDRYNSEMFPKHFEQVPRKGDYIRVLPDFHHNLERDGYPIRLEVVSVTWGDGWVNLELHFSDIDHRIFLANGKTL